MDSFYKKITFQEISKYGLHNIGDAIMTMAEAEQLQAHSNAVAIRLKIKWGWIMILKSVNWSGDNIRELVPYSSARDEFSGSASIFLDANENPHNHPLNRYPDPRQMELKKRLPG